MTNLTARRIAEIGEMLAAGMSPEAIAEELYIADGDDFFADREDDSDAGISRRHGISADDCFDIRGNALLPRFNDAGEPNWW